LVRSGVAPDHPKIKTVSKVFEKIAKEPNFRLFANVELGKDVSLKDMRDQYDAVVLATGATKGRKLGIPGEDLTNSLSAADFVPWYNSHPDYVNLEVDLSSDTAVVIGAGNVAMDVARILAIDPTELDPTDIANHALDKLKQSNIRTVIICGRRGPEHAAFTAPELRDLPKLENTDVYIDSQQIQDAESRISKLSEIEKDLKNTIFSYIPNTAEVAFYGLIKGMEEYLNAIKVERILSWGKDIDAEKLEAMVNRKIRQEKIAIKDVKLRTFITEDANRNEMVQHVYDITYGTVRKNEDSLVVIDDSIVRGTTLKESIVRMLSRLSPKKIIVVSSAPQIRYPDCYGIDMSKMGDFIAFKATIALLKERGMEQVMDDVYQKIKTLEAKNELHSENVVRELYKPFTTEEISDKIAQLITPDNIQIPVEVIYQTVEGLHACCPTNTGDWYFTGNYPTPGGNKVCNKAYTNYIEGNNQRGY
jgi:orotate phosphoribosyltransferase-like protein